MIFNWMVEGYRRLKKQKWIFSNPTSVDDTINRFNNAESSEDTFLIWLQNNCTKDVNNYETIAELFRACRDWHLDKGFSSYPMNVNHFGIAINEQQIIPVTDYRPIVDGKQVKSYKGIRLVK